MQRPVNQTLRTISKCRQGHGIPQYIIENGLRKVKPYFFQHQVHAKERWLKRTLLDVFATEFQFRDKMYYHNAIQCGHITVNGSQVEPTYVVQHNDLIIHHIHRHEPAVTAKPIEIIDQQDDFVVIDKPGGIPAHPGGRYRYNSVTQLLQRQLNVSRLFPANRLDLPTSGLMFIGLNVDGARRLWADTVEGRVQKEYLCRVVGKFPDRVVCTAPIKRISFRLSLHYVQDDGKPSETEFERISYDGTTSLVRCRPVTGRTHQIRVHLRYLGYPIANDPLYGLDKPWSHLLQEGQPLDEEYAANVVQTIAAHSHYPDFDPSHINACRDCGLVMTSDPPPNLLSIWLHAWRYASKDQSWAYETPNIPTWAYH
ncbi:hypothetical protein O0I10_011691, partial [Lichtheimia ornata]